MKRYEVTNTDNSLYPKMIFATSYVSPLSLLFHMAKDDLLKDFNGNVIFDLLLSNGFAPNRFLSIPFENGKFLYRSVSVVPKIDKELLAHSFRYFQAHPEYVETSSLPVLGKRFVLGK